MHAEASLSCQTLPRCSGNSVLHIAGGSKAAATTTYTTAL